MRGHLFYNQGLSINRASILFFMGANIQIKYEIALSRVHFLTQIALYSVHLILLYAYVYIFLEKSLIVSFLAANITLYRWYKDIYN